MCWGCASTTCPHCAATFHTLLGLMSNRVNAKPLSQYYWCDNVLSHSHSLSIIDSLTGKEVLLMYSLLFISTILIPPTPWIFFSYVTYSVYLVFWECLLAKRRKTLKSRVISYNIIIITWYTVYLYTFTKAL